VSKVSEHLEEANRHLDAAIQHHEDGSYHAARYRVGQAKKSVEDALGAELSSPAAAVNPTAAQGAQTSDGHSPRAADPFVGRLLASVRAGARELKR
jgi:hypothetical protein